MKKLITLFAFILVFFTIDAQKIYQSFTLDTVQGAETIYFTPGAAITSTTGSVGFFFKATNVNGTVDNVILQGSYDATNYVNIDTVAAASDGSYWLYDKIKTSLTYSITTTDTVTVSQADTLTILDTLYTVVADTCGAGDTTTVTFNGSNENISGNSGTATTSASASYTINNTSIAVNYLYYRLACAGGATDTCIYNPVIFVYKQE